MSSQGKSRIMNVKFISQGIESDSDSYVPAGNYINASLKEDYTRFSAFVAFVSAGGIENIKESLLSFRDNGGDIRLYVGVDMHGTSKEALQLLLDLGIPTYIVYSSNRIVYHPKIYAFESANRLKLLIGSSNLTVSGLYQNVEASVVLSGDNDDADEMRSFISDVYESFNLVLQDNSTICRMLNAELLELLVDGGLVISEKANIAISNEISKKHHKASLSSKTKLEEQFSKLKVVRPQKGYKRVLSAEIISGSLLEERQVVYERSPIRSNTMWVCTGKMTGGSRNILDLSKNGKRAGQLISGSVSFFVDDPNLKDYKNENIVIVYNGKAYYGNSLLYAIGNSNWRLQLKGEALDGSKLTDISRPYLGFDGGFAYKILLFHKLDQPDTYELSIASMDELNMLIEASSEWGGSGTAGIGREYGFINPQA